MRKRRPLTKPTPEEFGLTQDELRKHAHAASVGGGGGVWTVSAVFSWGWLTYLGIAWLLGDTPAAHLIGVGVTLGFTITMDLRSSSIAKGLAPTYKKINAYWEAERVWERQQENFWRALSGSEFEQELASLLRKRGYRNVKVMGGAGDGGVDPRVQDPDGVEAIIQAKRYAKPAGPAIVRELIGTLALHKSAKYAVLACTGGFSTGAEATAESHPNIRLWDLNYIMREARQVAEQSQPEPKPAPKPEPKPPAGRQPGLSYTESVEKLKQEQKALRRETIEVNAMILGFIALLLAAGFALSG